MQTYIVVARCSMNWCRTTAALYVFTCCWNLVLNAISISIWLWADDAIHLTIYAYASLSTTDVLSIRSWCLGSITVRLFLSGCCPHGGCSSAGCFVATPAYCFGACFIGSISISTGLLFLINIMNVFWIINDLSMSRLALAS